MNRSFGLIRLPWLIGLARDGRRQVQALMRNAQTAELTDRNFDFTQGLGDGAGFGCPIAYSRSFVERIHFNHHLFRGV